MAEVTFQQENNQKLKLKLRAAAKEEIREEKAALNEEGREEKAALIEAGKETKAALIEDREEKQTAKEVSTPNWVQINNANTLQFEQQQLVEEEEQVESNQNNIS